TDVNGANEDLRHCNTSVGALDHFVAALPVAADIDLTVGRASAFQQSLGCVAIRAITGRIDLDGRRSVYELSTLLYGTSPCRHNRSEYQHIDLCSAARNNVRVQASTVAPDVSTSSTSTGRRPAISTLCSSGTRNARWTLSARSTAGWHGDPANRRYRAGKNGRFAGAPCHPAVERSEEHTSELQSLTNLVCRL